MQSHLNDVQVRLASAESERERAAAAHEGLIERLRQLDRQVRVQGTRNPSSDALLSNLEQSAIDVMAERGRLAVESDRLAADRRQLNAELTELQRKQTAVAATHEAAITELNDRTKAGIDGLKRLIARTGLDADKLVGVRAPGGAGGPFIPSLGNAQQPSSADKAQATLVGLGTQIGRLEEMRRLLRSLPTGAPLDSYNIMSPFGVRREPFNGQPAVHNGVDLAAPMKTPIMATASGVVVFAGWNGEFGNMVEIDHGYGVTTRYGHMSHIYVKVGQRIAGRHVVGLVGTTGRSTGPHVHYEVLSDGKNLNPAKFLEVARYVPKS
jgi:murein DD-endopeptidase MepM/ murein hydrolase activator NlpD